MSNFLNKKYKDLTPYVPGEQPQNMNYIKLNTNESPYPPSPAVLDAVGREQMELLRLYSDPCCKNLTEKLAALYGVSCDEVFFSNGSDDILSFAFMAFSGEDRPAVFPDISYGFYKVFAQLHGTPYREIPLAADFSVNAGDYIATDRFTVIANPNAPTGMTLSVEELERIIASNPRSVVVIDEAYIDFGGESCVPLIHKYDNLLVVQTFSKSRSMAGARLGFALGGKGLIADLNKIKYSTNPYNINRLTMAAGEAAIDSDAYYKEKCALIAKTRRYLTGQLEEMNFTVLPSNANFVFASHEGVTGGLLYDELKARGVLIRHFTAPRINNFIRITVGTPEQTDILLNRLREILTKMEAI